MAKVTLDADALPDAIVESVFAVLEQRGYILAKPSDCQYPLDGQALAKLKRELGRNVAGALAAMDESDAERAA